MVYPYVRFTPSVAGVINRMRGYRIQAAFILVCALSACGSAPRRTAPPLYLNFNPATQAYWTNPYWQADLFAAVQSAAHLPANTTSPATPGIHGAVRFTYDNGAIKDPEIVTSTGDPDLDKLLLQQVVSAKAPKPLGQHTDQPHDFELPLDMPTYFEWFENNIYAAIDRKKGYSKDAILKNIMGITAVDFDYLDGKALNIVIAKSSGNKELDQISVGTVSNAELPAAPTGYTGKTLPLQVIFCYDVNLAKKCPTGKNIMDVEGTRIRRVETYYMYH